MKRPFSEARYNALLNGLEISEVRFSELIKGKRIDAEVYEKRYVEIDNLLANYPTTLLGDICKTLKKGIFDVNASVYSDSGIPFIRISNLKDMQIQGDYVYIPHEVDYENNKTHLSKDDIILSKTAYAAASLVTTKECNVSQDTVALKLKKNSGILSEFLVVFLNTKEGLLSLQRWFTGNIQMHLNLEDCSNIVIPLLPTKFQTLVGKLLQEAIELRKTSETYTEISQRRLLDELNYTNPQRPENATTKLFSSTYAVTGRLDAEFYQPKYDELFEHIYANAEYVKTIAEMESFNARGLQPVYAENGSLNVINSRHILEDGMDYDNFEKTQIACWDSQKRARIMRNDVLVYTTGANIGRSQPYLSDEKALASNHVNILRITEEDPIYVAFVMNSIIGRMQTDRLSAGTAQAELYPKDIAQFVIPFVSKEKQKEIVGNILESRAKKKESHQLLEKAKKAVEIAIEHGEDAAMAYLDGKQYVEQSVRNELAAKAPYFSIDAVRKWLADQKMSYKPDTVKSYLSRQQRAGKIFDAGRGWYSSIEEPYQLDTAPVKELVDILGRQFPLLEFACWSTAQLNDILRHQLSRHINLIYVERDAIESVSSFLRAKGFHAFANPGKREIEKFFSIEGNTIVVLPLTSESPEAGHFASFEKIVVDVVSDLRTFKVINIQEFAEHVRKLIKSYRIDIAILKRYATRRKTDIGPLLKGIIIH